MRPVILFPATEEVVASYLRTRLALQGETKVTVDTTSKSPVPIPYVCVRRISGGPKDVVLDSARLDVLVWHFDDDKRMALARLVHALLLGIANDEVDNVRLYCAASFLAPIHVPDPTDSNRRVAMLSVEVTARGQALPD